MELDYLKDKLFDLLNDYSDDLYISDIQTHEMENTFGLSMTDGSVFELEFRRVIEGKEKL